MRLNEEGYGTNCEFESLVVEGDLLLFMLGS